MHRLRPLKRLHYLITINPHHLVPDYQLYLPLFSFLDQFFNKISKIILNWLFKHKKRSPAIKLDFFFHFYFAILHSNQAANLVKFLPFIIHIISLHLVTSPRHHLNHPIDLVLWHKTKIATIIGNTPMVTKDEVFASWYRFSSVIP